MIRQFFFLFNFIIFWVKKKTEQLFSIKYNNFDLQITNRQIEKKILLNEQYHYFLTAHNKINACSSCRNDIIENSHILKSGYILKGQLNILANLPNAITPVVL